MKFILEIPDAEIREGATPEEVALSYQNALCLVAQSANQPSNLTVDAGPDYGLDLQRLEQVTIDYVGTDEELEVDPLTRFDVSPGEDGIWVRAWVFMDNEYLSDNGIENPEAVKDDEGDEEGDDLS